MLDCMRAMVIGGFEDMIFYIEVDHWEKVNIRYFFPPVAGPFLL
jgi:hypothetical protein